MIKKAAALQAGKLYTIKNNGATYTIVLGDIAESINPTSSSLNSSVSALRTGVGAPQRLLGVAGDIYVDVFSKKIFTRDGSGWDSGFSLGSSGSNGTNGRTTLEGSGPPSNAVVYAAALADAGISAADVQNGDLYLDTLDHVFYKRSSGAWVSRTSHKGKNGRTIFEGSGDPDDPASVLPSDISDAAEGDLYHDVVNFKWHHRNSSGIPGSRWDARSTYLGPIGPTGLNGQNGQDGNDGRTTLEGNGAPTDPTAYAAALADAGISDSDVKNGDLYLDTLNHVFYKRSSGSWVSRTSHKGKNGRTIFEGSGDPDDPASELPSDISDAAEGDLYHDIANFKWHRRNSSGIPGSRWDARSTYLGPIGPSGLNGTDGKDGKDGVVGQLTNDSDVIPTNSDGSGYDFTDTGGEFEIRDGGTKITSGVAYYAGATGTNSSVVVNGLTLSITSGGIYSLSGASWTQPFAKFTMRAVYSGVTYTKVYKVSKARSGLRGNDGSNGNNGSNGKDGTNGTDALTGHLSNEADVLPAANDGTGYSLVGTGGTFFVYSGKTQVSPSNFYVGPAGTSTTQTISGLTLSINSSGLYSLSGASWSSDSASFTLRAIYDGVTLTKVYKISKSKAGSKGDVGATGPQGLKGATGAQGVGYDFYVDALGADTLLTYNSFTYLKFGDNERDTSSLVSESGSASSTYTVAAGKAGRYRIEFNLALKNVISSAGSSYDVESYVYVNGSERATASMSASPFSASYPATKYRNLYCTCVLYLQEGATIQFAAKRTSSDSKITIYANKLDKTTESGEDTSVTITKL